MTIYFVQGVDFGPVKIGHTAHQQASARLRDLQVGSPVSLVLRSTIPGGMAREHQLHRQFQDLRLHGEWFEPCPEMELIARCRLRADGQLLFYRRSAELPDDKRLNALELAIVRLLLDHGGWMSAARMARQLRLGKNARGLGARLSHLRRRGWVISRQVLSGNRPSEPWCVPMEWAHFRFAGRLGVSIVDREHETYGVLL